MPMELSLWSHHPAGSVSLSLVRVAKHALSTDRVLPPWGIPPLDETPSPAPGTSYRHLLCSPHTDPAAHPFTIPEVIKEKRFSLGSRGECAITAAHPAICMQCTFGITKLLKTGGGGNIKSNY